MKKRISLAAIILMATILACAAPNFTESPVVPTSTSIQLPSTPASSLPSQNPAANQDALVSLYENVSPGIVSLRVTTKDSGSLGSGFVFDSLGHIITNFHVIEGAVEVEVHFMSGFKTYGTVIGADLDSDIAVVKVDAPASELHPLPIGDSSQLKVGQTVVAVGNPFGLDGTMTVGIVSALGRTLDSIHSSPTGGFFTAGDIIQTDAAINPGNSGGPLFNTASEVIGVNRAIRTTNYNETGDPVNSGIGFAISANVVARVVPFLIRDGHYDYPYLGVASMDDFGLAEKEALGLTSFTGAYVTNVVPGGPADKAGVKAGTQSTASSSLKAGGDLIIAIDGKSIRRFDELLAYLIANKSPGDTVVLTVLRGSEKVDITVTLAKRPK